MVWKVLVMLSPREPEKIEGSVELSYVYSPGTAQSSTTLPCSTIIMHCPSAIAIPEPLVMILSLAFVFDDLLPMRLCPFVTSSSFGIASQ